jgi:integrase
MKRSRNRKTKQLTHITSFAAAIGRQWAHAPQKVQHQLEKLRVAYRWEYSGISVKNRVLLSQFDAPAAIDRLLSVPSKLQAMARAMPRDAESARLMRCAVAIEILINSPMRTSELLGLKIANCLLTGKSRPASLQLTQYRFFSERLQTSAISERCSSLINEYMRHYRSLISPSKCDSLFLARNGAALGSNAMTAAIKKWCLKLGGVEVTPTLFRHFAAKHFLEQHPDKIGALQGVMGHQSAVSTGATYRSLRASQASKFFDAAMFKSSRATT